MRKSVMAVIVDRFNLENFEIYDLCKSSTPEPYPQPNISSIKDFSGSLFVIVHDKISL